MSSHLAAVVSSGTSIWLDDLSRERLIESATPNSLSFLIKNEFVTGVTTNPIIFSQAISKSDLYAGEIKALAKSGADAESIITKLTTDDVRGACDLFTEIHHKSNGIDGRVSIEVDPRLARDTKTTISQGKELWKLVNRPNLLIKVPATVEGLPAITALIADGISVNVTIIFSVERYREVLNAFMDGLEERLVNGKPVNEIHSVASFFISRVDSEVDSQLKALSEPNAASLLGKAAIANARLAYQEFIAVRASARWQLLSKNGAHIQRPLWASTGVKDKAYDDTRYVIELIGPDTVNTMPQGTLDAVKDHGVSRGDALTPNIKNAVADLAALKAVGISMVEVAIKLEREGIDKFVAPWIELIETVKKVASN